MKGCEQNMSGVSYHNIKGNPNTDKTIKIWVPSAGQYLEVDKSTGGNIYTQSGKKIGYVSSDGYIRLNSQNTAPESSINGSYIPDYNGSWD